MHKTYNMYDREVLCSRIGFVLPGSIPTRRKNMRAPFARVNKIFLKYRIFSQLCIYLNLQIQRFADLRYVNKKVGIDDKREYLN